MSAHRLDLLAGAVVEHLRRGVVVLIPERAANAIDHPYGVGYALQSFLHGLAPGGPGVLAVHLGHPINAYACVVPGPYRDANGHDSDILERRDKLAADGPDGLVALDLQADIVSIPGTTLRALRPRDPNLMAGRPSGGRPADSHAPGDAHEPHPV